MPLLISSVVMVQTQNKETINSTEKLLCPINHYDDERDKIVFHNTTLDLQEQDHSVQGQEQDRFFCLRPVLRTLS